MLHNKSWEFVQAQKSQVPHKWGRGKAIHDQTESQSDFKYVQAIPTFNTHVLIENL